MKTNHLQMLCFCLLFACCDRAIAGTVNIRGNIQNQLAKTIA